MNNISIRIIPSPSEKLTLSDKDIIEIINNSLTKIRPGLTNKLEIEIIIATEEEIRDLNREHRKIDASTDVLSFPQDQIRQSLINILGSIVICPKKVIEKNEDLSDVIKHGLLHLLGYDHETDGSQWEIAAKKIDCGL